MRPRSDSAADFVTIIWVFIVSQVAWQDILYIDTVGYTAQQNTVNTTNAAWKGLRTGPQPISKPLCKPDTEVRRTASGGGMGGARGERKHLLGTVLPDISDSQSFSDSKFLTYQRSTSFSQGASLISGSRYFWPVIHTNSTVLPSEVHSQSLGKWFPDHRRLIVTAGSSVFLSTNFAARIYKVQTRWPERRVFLVCEEAKTVCGVPPKYENESYLQNHSRKCDFQQVSERVCQTLSSTFGVHVENTVFFWYRLETRFVNGWRTSFEDCTAAVRGETTVVFLTNPVRWQANLRSNRFWEHILARWYSSIALCVFISKMSNWGQ